MARYSPEERERMVAIYRAERSLMRTASRFGCSHNTVRAALRDVGCPVSPSGGRRGPRDPLQPVRSGVRKASNGYVGWWFAWHENGERRTAEFLEHRIVMEHSLGRPLARHETVHHKNGLRDDNRLENLELWIGKHPAGASHCPHCGGKL